MQGTLQVLQTYITLAILEEGRVNGAMQSALELMAFYHRANQRAAHVPLSAFYNDAGVQLPQPCARCVRKVHTAAPPAFAAWEMHCLAAWNKSKAY